MKNLINFELLISIRFFIFISFFILVLFLFFDVYLFELSRSFPGILFSFFKNIIDPLSSILDPLNLIIICLLTLLLNSNVKVIIKNEKKFEIIRSKTDFDIEKVKDLFAYTSLVCRHFVFSLALAGIFCNILKYVFGVSRPKYFFLEGYERINFFNLEHKVSSFPSGHTQAAFTLAVLIIIYSKRYYFVIISFAILMGLSRIFMSMHFPSDIVAGAYLGSLVPIILYNLSFKYKIEKIKKKHDFFFKDLVRLMYWRMFI